MQTFHPIRLGNSTSLTTSASSQRVALPTTAAGTAPKFVRVNVGTNGGSLGYAYFKLGDSGVTATSNDLLGSSDSVIVLNATGCTHIAVLSFSLSTVPVNIAAVEA